MEIDLLTYSPIYSNKQDLLFKIINKNDNNTYNIQFDDGTIINYCIKEYILWGNIKNPNSNIIFNKLILVYIHDCYQKALLCNTRNEFYIKYKKYYAKARKMKWLNIICNHMENKLHYYTFEECLKKALLCNTRIEFYNKFRNYYDKARRENWLNSICYKMKTNLNQYDFDRIIYAYIFKETKSIYIGLTKDFKRRHNSRIWHNNDSVMTHINETGLEPEIKFLTDFIPAIDAEKQEQNFIDKYRSEGWNILNKYKGGSLGGSKTFSIKEKL